MTERKIGMRRRPPEKQQVGRMVLMLSLLAALSVPLDALAQRGGLFGYDSEEKGYGLLGNGNRGGMTGTLGNQGFGATNGTLYNQGFGSTLGGLDNQGFGGMEGGITNQGFGETPLGNGLLILLAASAGYATLNAKRKRNKPNKKNQK